MEYTIEFRGNNGAFDTLLLLLDGKIASEWTCTPFDVRNFVNDSNPSEWDDQCRYDSPEWAGPGYHPEDYGDLFATRESNGALIIHDAEKYQERLCFYGLREY